MRSGFRGIVSSFGRWHSSSSINALVAYAAAGFIPAYVLDFVRNKYFVDGEPSTQKNAVTHSRASNATMTGLTAWSPHNYVGQSNNVSGSEWSEFGNSGGKVAALSATDIEFQAGASVWANNTQFNNSTLVGNQLTLECFISALSDAGEKISIEINYRGATNDVIEVTLTATPTLVSVSGVVPSGSSGVDFFIRNNSSGAAKVVTVTKPRIFRSDQGGMVDTANGDKYVPTTDAPVLPVRQNLNPNTNYGTSGTGVVQWGPHNLLSINSNDFTTWQNNNCSLSTGKLAPDGTNTATELTSGSGDSALLGSSSSGAGQFTFEVWLRSDTITDFLLDIQGSGHLTEVVTVSTEWQLVSTTKTSTSNLIRVYLGGFNNFVNGETIEVWKARVYRSDLGGMVNNPETRDSYVPTTDAAKYLPRIGHHLFNGTSYINEGLLSESDAQTNLYPNSADTDTTSSFDLTKTSNSAVSPDGTTTADLITPINDARHLFQFVGYSSAGDGSDETYSFYAKSNGYNIFEVSQRNQGGGTITKFDLSAETVTTTAGTEIFSALEDVGNGWYRCSAAYITSSANPYPAVEFLDTDGSRGFDADGTSGIYFWGHQLEPASTSSSLIPTKSAAVTRAAETFVTPAAKMPAYTDAVSIAMAGRITYADSDNGTEAVFYRWRTDVNNKIRARLRTSSDRTGEVLFEQAILGTSDSVVSAQDTYSAGINVPYRIASRHGSTFINGAIDGTALTADTTPTAIADLSTGNFDISEIYNGTIKNVIVWPENITDAGTVDASEPSLEPSLSITFGPNNNSFTVSDWSA